MLQPRNSTKLSTYLRITLKTDTRLHVHSSILEIEDPSSDKSSIEHFSVIDSCRCLRFPTCDFIANPLEMKLYLLILLLALLALGAFATAPQKAIIVTYPSDTPSSVMDEAMAEVEKAVFVSL